MNHKDNTKEEKFMKTNIRKISAIVCSLVVLTTAVCSSSLFTTAQSTPETTKESLDIVEFNCDTGTTREYTFEYDSIDINAPGAAQMLTSAPEQCTTEKTTSDISTRNILPNSSFGKVNATVSPYRKVLYIRSYGDSDGNGQNDYVEYGTAFLVHDDLALTAAHCVMEDGKYSTRMEIYTKQNSKTLNSTYYSPKQWSIPVNYSQNGNINYDWCIIKLKNNLGSSNSLGHFEYKVPTATEKIFVNGYPTDTTYRYFQCMGQGNFSLESGGFVLVHTASTMTGMSGGPVYNKSEYVVGIQRSGGSSYNYACKITQALYNLIETCKNE